MNGNAMEIERIKRYGRVLQRLTLVIILLAPVVAFFLVYDKGPLALVTVPSGIHVDKTHLGFLGSIAVIAVGLLTPATYLLGFVFLYRLFNLYAQGIVFSRPNVDAIRWGGYVLIAVDMVRVVQSALIGPVLSVLGVTRSYLTVEIGISTLVIGLAIVLISHVMGLGCTIYERDRLTI
jgi:hypothetical protein